MNNPHLSPCNTHCYSNICQFKSRSIIHPITSHSDHFTVFFEQSNYLLLVFRFCPGEKKATLLP